jgi:RNA polymerase sigma-70 factor (ECF subfamily)
MKSTPLSVRNQIHDPGNWAKLYDDYLQRFARARINDPEIVKDLVQETFLAALTSLDNFQGRSSVKTWLTSILRNKIVDYYRTYRRELTIGDIELDVISINAVFGSTNRWRVGSNQHNFHPVNAYEQMEFFEVLHRCLAELPIRLAYIFILHQFVGLRTDEICEDMNISKTNCWVMLHRARKFLKHSLEFKWIKA